MTVVFNSMSEFQLGISAVFVCIAAGFFVLALSFKGNAGPFLWGVAFLANAAGFAFWSGIAGSEGFDPFLVGEIFHVAGFFSLAAGAIVSGRIRPNRLATAVFVVLWFAVWLGSLAGFETHPALAGRLLKLLRAALLFLCGALLLPGRSKAEAAGRNISGFSLIAWSAYLVASMFAKIDAVLYYGFLVGLQVLSAFGMVSLVIDRMKTEKERMERQVERLEGILPICSYCKRIRDENGAWHALEAYIEDRSKAEFSHGICPACFARHRPDK